jgi:hypothetical protein
MIGARAMELRGGALALAFALAVPVTTASADEDRGELRGLRLGTQAGTMSTDGFDDFACGSNGGPPRAPLSGWTDFHTCRPEASGLHEVYVRFDEQQAYQAKAFGDPTLPSEADGTRVAGHPVILSVLFNDSGIAQEIRIVTDPRAPLSLRRMAQLLRLRVIAHYGEEDWACVDLPPEPGETPVGKIFIKQRCEKTTPEHHLIMQARLLRKLGQTDYDPVTKEFRPGQFESSTRLEILDPSLKLE